MSPNGRSVDLWDFAAAAENSQHSHNSQVSQSMSSVSALNEHIHNLLGDSVLSSSQQNSELSVSVAAGSLRNACETLRDDPVAAFDQLIDICGVDYLTYGAEDPGKKWDGDRFAVVYHLLSVKHNHRLRVKTFLKNEAIIVDSVTNVWESADWFEREVFDLYGILFDGHPDLRRILTDYGFIGHPFRKDFPLSGYVEMRYDPDKGRVVYEPVSIEPRTLVPRIIREDNFGDRNS